jgi:hypothetical protein
MVRKSYSAMILAAAAALVMVGCGKEDITDLQDTWVKKEGDVVTKLTDLKTKNQEIRSKFDVVKAANITDTVKLADRTIAETMLSDHDSQIGQIETTIASLKAKRDSAATMGKRADYEAAWKAAETEYEGLLAKISTLESQNGEIGNKVDGLANTNTAAIDTAATTPSGTDTAAAKASADEKKPSEDASKTAEGTTEKKADTPATSK